MKTDSFPFYIDTVCKGKNYIEMNIIEKPRKEHERYKPISRKINDKITQIDIVFNELKKIKGHTTMYNLFLSEITRYLKNSIYNDLVINPKDKINDKTVKDELYGYVKFKKNILKTNKK